MYFNFRYSNVSLFFNLDHFEENGDNAGCYMA